MHVTGALCEGSPYAASGSSAQQPAGPDSLFHHILGPTEPVAMATASSINARGHTTTPLSSPTTMSPGLTGTPPQTIGTSTPTVLRRSLLPAGTRRVMLANTGQWASTIASGSRTEPSTTVPPPLPAPCSLHCRARCQGVGAGRRAGQATSRQRLAGHHHQPRHAPDLRARRPDPDPATGPSRRGVRLRRGLH